MNARELVTKLKDFDPSDQVEIRLEQMDQVFYFSIEKLERRSQFIIDLHVKEDENAIHPLE